MQIGLPPLETSREYFQIMVAGEQGIFFLYIKPDFRIPFTASYLVSQKCFPLYKIRSVAKCHLGKVKSQANAVSGLLLERAWSVGWPQGPFAYLVIFADLLLERIFADSGSQPVLPLLCIGKYGVIWVFSTKFFQAWRCRLAAHAGVVAARRVAMDSSLLCLRRSGSRPTFKAPVPKLIYWWWV